MIDSTWTTPTVLLPHRDFPRQVQVQVSHPGSVLKRQPRLTVICCEESYQLTPLILLLSSKERDTHTIRGSHAFLAAVSEAGPSASNEVQGVRSTVVPRGHPAGQL
jgi:hypothetical protein